GRPAGDGGPPGQRELSPPRRPDRRRDSRRASMSDGSGQRFLNNPKCRCCDVAVNRLGERRGDWHIDARDGRHAFGLMLYRPSEISMIQLRRTQPCRDPAYRRDAEIDLSNGRLEAVDDICGCLDLAQTPNHGTEIQFDAREELAKLIVQVPGGARALLFAHLLDSLRQRAQRIRIEACRFQQEHIAFEIQVGGRGVQEGYTFNTMRLSVIDCRCLSYTNG